MANDDWYKNLPPEARKAFDKASQNLKDNEAKLKDSSYGVETPARRADYANANEPKLNETVFPNQEKGQSQESNQRGAQLIQQKRDEAQKESQTPKAPEQSKDQSSNSSTKNKDQDKDR